MKYLLVSDLHLDSRQPACWQQDKDYAKWSIDRIQYIKSLARRHEVQAIILPGDFFDRPTLPYEFINDIRDIINVDNIPIITTLGQHDIRGHNTDTYRNSAIGCLTSDKFHILRKGEEHMRVCGYGWGDLETENFLVNGNPAGDIAIIHASIGTHNIEWLLNREPKLPKLVLFGDIHPGFGPVKYGDTILLNLGSWSKNKIDETWPLRYAIYDSWDGELTIHNADALDQDVFDQAYLKKLEDSKALAERIDIESVSIALAKLKDKAAESTEVRLSRMAEALLIKKSVVKRVLNELNS